MIVVVTNEDIAAGVKCSCRNCPIAKAIQRACPNVKIEASASYVMINDDDYRLPPEAEQFIRAFDRGDPVSPFSFTLESK